MKRDSHNPARRRLLLNAAGGTAVAAFGMGSAIAVTKTWDREAAAVISLTRSAAHEYGQYSIRVVAVAPGPIDTPMLRAADPDGKIVDAVSLHRIGTPADIANAVLWLAGDSAAHVSGSLLTVDGAFLAA